MSDESKSEVNELELKLYKYLLAFTKLKLEKVPCIEGIKIVELKQLNVHNYYGIKISECILIHNTNLTIPYSIKAVYQVHDFLPLSHPWQAHCIIQGTVLEDTFIDFINHISRKAYCRDCGRIINDTDYIAQEEQCYSCAFESLILLVKGETDFCSICQSFTARYVILKCGHKFHRKCISKLLKNNCPLCNKEIEAVDV